MSVSKKQQCPRRVEAVLNLSAIRGLAALPGQCLQRCGAQPPAPAARQRTRPTSLLHLLTTRSYCSSVRGRVASAVRRAGDIELIAPTSAFPHTGARAVSAISCAPNHGSWKMNVSQASHISYPLNLFQPTQPYQPPNHLTPRLQQ